MNTERAYCEGKSPSITPSFTPTIGSFVAGFASLEQIQNCFTIFRASELCSDLGREMTNEHREGVLRGEKSIDNTIIYAYYRQLLLQMPNLKPWAMFALFLLVFPKGIQVKTAVRAEPYSSFCSFNDRF